MTENRIIKRDAINKIKIRMSELKDKNKKISEEVNTLVENATKREKKALEDAIEKYNDKMTEIYNSSLVKKKLDEKYECEDKIVDLMTKVKTSFKRAIREINSQPISEAEKDKKIQALSEAIQDAILSKDEKEIMKAIKQQMQSLPYRSLRLMC